ncbi:MAG: DUF5668 domain-containing protein [Anaerolineales bacterium]|nr:DUF5668 domain-containing protein [Anaerolineales bacterium]
MSEEKMRPRRRPSIFWPLVLIALGVVLLLNNVGALRGDFWESAYSYWPLILIAIGLDGIYRGEGLTGATFMAGLGVIFLLANLGYLRLDVWWVVLHFWPILLIAIGFDILIARRSLLASLLGMAAILAILLGGLWLFGSPGFGSAGMSGDAFQEPLGQARMGEIILKPAAGELRLAAGDDPDLLVSGQVPSTTSVEFDSSVEASKASFSLASRQGAAVTFPGAGGQSTWVVALNSQVPLNVAVDMGVGNSELNLADLQLEGLDVNQGIGRAVITLPETGEFYGKANLAIGQLVLLVPRGRAVRLHIDKGLVVLSLPAGFVQDGESYRSQDAGAGAELLNLDLNVAIGVLTVKYLD